MSNLEDSFLPELKKPISSHNSEDESPFLVGGAEKVKIVYKSGLMRDLMNMVRRIAPSNATTLILGESGTGKELIAHAIHENSPRKDKPFVAINCGALRESLLGK